MIQVIEGLDNGQVIIITDGAEKINIQWQRDREDKFKAGLSVVTIKQLVENALKEQHIAKLEVERANHIEDILENNIEGVSLDD